jgi:hypothetical protein
MKIAKNYRLNEELISDIETISKLQNRSATNLIETVMKEYVKIHLPDKAKEQRVKNKK